MKVYKKKNIFIFLIIIFFSLFVFQKSFQQTSFKELLAGVFFVDSITEIKLKTDYYLAKLGKDKIKILIVAGHDDNEGGTDFRGIREAELNMELTKYLNDFLSVEKEFDVILLRDENGYNPEYLSYLKSNKEEIFEFQNKHKKTMNNLVDLDLIDLKSGVFHNTASSEAIQKLYGINKWVNDTDVDIVLHIHFNDYPRRIKHRAGEYSGFSIYVPDSQYSNSKPSYSLAESISDFLSKFFAYSDYIKESGDRGIVEDQELIAIGAYNTLDSVSLLIEYGYIYEPQFTAPEVREHVLSELALQTYLGVKSYFNSYISDRIFNLPYKLEKNLKKGMRNDKDVFILQILLASEGFYPPENYDLNECPISGNFGNCTLRAVKQFQKNYNISPISGFVGSLTREKINEIQ